MKKIIVVFVSIMLSLIVFKGIDQKGYVNKKKIPLLDSFEIHKGNKPNEYQFIYRLNDQVDFKEVQGARMFLHGTPSKDQLALLPEKRKQYGFDNWNFTINLRDDGTFVRKINSNVDSYDSLRMGIYKKPNGEKIEGRTTLSLVKLSMKEGKLEFTHSEINSLKTYNFYEVSKVKWVIFISILISIFIATNIIILEKSLVYLGILLFPGLLYVIGGTTKGSIVTVVAMYYLVYGIVFWLEKLFFETSEVILRTLLTIIMVVTIQKFPIIGFEESSFLLGNTLGTIFLIINLYLEKK
ncbi:hypothetical protein [Propionigenium maris]|nr:hypothetical protein [Propionigenium maris]